MILIPSTRGESGGGNTLKISVHVSQTDEDNSINDLLVDIVGK